MVVTGGDTIFAPATARGQAGIAVVCVSGPRSHDAVAALAGDVPALRRASLRTLSDPTNGERLDQALILCFGPGASFTGEAMAELQVHGGAAVVSGVLEALARLPGLRLAEPGAFTRRALDNGRLDLAQVEGLADLIAAETALQRRQALKVMQGALSARTEAWRAALVRAMALLAVTIDFADEEVPEDVRAEVAGLVGEVKSGIAAELAGSVAAERVRDGFEVAIVGAPNVGKSTLLNCLAGREAAITSSVAGTTRDVIEVRMDLSGLPVTLLDTAGLRETSDAVERIGVARATERAIAADLRVFLVEGEERLPVSAQPGDITVGAKADLGGEGVSGLTGLGVERLLAEIGDVLGARASGASSAIRLRHRLALEAALGDLESAEAGVMSGEAEEVVAEMLRQAVRSLDVLVGRVDVEDILDVVFSSFCLGK